MKKLFLISFLLPFLGAAQNDNSLLWKVTREGNDHTSYLFGSIHSNDSLINTFDRTWWAAFESCDLLVGEVNMTDPGLLMESMTAGMMKDSSLSDFYSDEELKRVQQFMLSKMDVMTATIVGKMKPFYILAAIMEMPKEDSPYKMVMDFRLQALAQERNVKVIGLETPAEQAVSIDVMSLREQAQLLLTYVDMGEGMSHEMEIAEKHYYNQDLILLAAMEQEFEAPDALMESIVDGRNEKFVSRLLPHLMTNNVFCAVGALHLPGQSGLIAQLRKNGYRVTPVSFKFEE